MNKTVTELLCDSVFWVRSKRRTVCLEVKPSGEVFLRTPYRYTKVQALAFLQKNEGWLEKAKLRVAEKQSRHPEPTPEEIKQLKEKAREVLPPLVERYAARLGVQPTALHITSAKTRFGSCSGKNAISFSWRLMQYPTAAIEYVVVHELSHILHHNHSHAFYQCIQKILPDYLEREKLLKM